MSRIQELAEIIATNTTRIGLFLQSQGLPLPSFEINAPTALSLSDELEVARKSVLEATTELHELLLGPKELILSNIVSVFKWKLVRT